ncbi:MAG: SRPBCC family protein [Gemmatimonadaceae bacterium]|nr:SRPBCC family protein [Gemmatimonadaceae bacterium]
MTADDFPADRELVFTRVFDAPPSAVFRGWTDPAWLVQWFTPPPWQTVRVVNDVRTGGSTRTLMRGPDGTEMDNPGVYLEVDAPHRLVFTDAFTHAWAPSGKPFMVGILAFDDDGAGGTRFTARLRHWSVDDRAAHEAMGFPGGWEIAHEQLAELLRREGIGRGPA